MTKNLLNLHKLRKKNQIGSKRRKNRDDFLKIPKKLQSLTQNSKKKLQNWLKKPKIILNLAQIYTNSSKLTKNDEKIQNLLNLKKNSLKN